MTVVIKNLSQCLTYCKLLLISFFMWFTAELLGKLPFLNEIWIQGHLTYNYWYLSDLGQGDFISS